MATDMKRWNDIVRGFLGEDFFTEVTKSVRTSTATNEPPSDVYYGKNEVIVLVDLPGIGDINRSLDMKVQGQSLVIKGQLPNPFRANASLAVERRRGAFEKTIPLGSGVSSKYTSAKYRQGVLELRFPRTSGR